MNDSSITAHALAAQLLAGPDLPVIGQCVGQGSNEMGDEDFSHLEISGDYYSGAVVSLCFSYGLMTMAPPNLPAT